MTLRSEPIVRLLAIGDELLLGRTVDTNSPWIAHRLGAAGLRVAAMRQVGDAEDTLVAALRDAADGAALVVCCGGLGPTDDDRTRQALARAMGVSLEERADCWAAITAFHHRLGRLQVSESNRRQACLPQGAEPLANDRGTAPGMLGRIGSCWVACLPGVPHEMKAMAEALFARLPELVPGLVVPAVTEVVFSGIAESAAQEAIGALMTEREPQVGINVTELGHLILRVVGRADQVAERAEALRRCLTPYLLPGATIADSIVERLRSVGATVSLAESCTAGHGSAQLLAVPGASQVLRQSAVTYAVEVKQALLGLCSEDLRDGVVSARCAEAMALGVRRWAGSDLGIATTGIAGPDGGTAEDPVGTVWVAVADRYGVYSRKIRVVGTRTRIQSRAAAGALQLAWERIRGWTVDSNHQVLEH
jgi:nicotinamide-nucleotide amidase